MSNNSTTSLCVWNIYRIKWSSESISGTSKKCSLKYDSNIVNSGDKKVNMSKAPLSFKFYSLLAEIQNKTFQKGK